MPPRTRGPGIEQQARDEVGRELDDLTRAVAAEIGPVEGAHILSDDAETDAWQARDPRVDRDQLVSMLMAGQVPPEWTDEQSDQRLAVIRASPELAAMFQQGPLDQEMAHLVAGLAEYPFRHRLLAPYEDDPASMVRRANAINGRAPRRSAREQAPAAPEEGLAPPATLPSPPSPVGSPLPPLEQIR